MEHAKQVIATSHQPELNSAEILAAGNYIRERTNPNLGDIFYLCLLDLKNFVASRAGKFNGSVLDYGCGGSPYKSLFENCNRYVRADMLAGPSVDLVLGADGKTLEPNSSYNGVVSFQVLEHVRDPGAYLDECYRILAPDGLLLLTTHGLYLEHKCPDDFHRWTSQGLEELVQAHGFSVSESVKLTTGLRGALQLQHHVVEEFRTQGALRRFLRKLYQLACQPVLNAVASIFLKGEAIVPATGSANMYSLVGVLAKKSSSVVPSQKIEPVQPPQVVHR
jgi:SAM-dependent methyltransferase